MPQLLGPCGVCSLLVFVSALILNTQGRPRSCGLRVSPTTGLVQLFPGNDATVMCTTDCDKPLRRGQIFWRDPRGQRVTEYSSQRVTTVNYDRWTVSRLLVRRGQPQDSGVYTCEFQFGSRLLQYPVTIQIEDTTTRDPGPVRGDIYIHPEPDLPPIRAVRSASRELRRRPRHRRENADVPAPVRPLTLSAQPAEQSQPLADAAGNQNVVKVNDVLFEFDPEVTLQESNRVVGDGDDDDSVEEDEAEDGKSKRRVRRQVTGAAGAQYGGESSTGNPMDYNSFGNNNTGDDASYQQPRDDANATSATEAQSGADRESYTGSPMDYSSFDNNTSGDGESYQPPRDDANATNAAEAQPGAYRESSTVNPMDYNSLGNNDTNTNTSEDYQAGNQYVANDRGAQSTDPYGQPMSTSGRRFDERSTQAAQGSSSSTPESLSTTGSAGLSIPASSSPVFDGSSTPFTPPSHVPPSSSSASASSASSDTSSESAPVLGRSTTTDTDTTTTRTTTAAAAASTSAAGASDDEENDDSESEDSGEVLVGGDASRSTEGDDDDGGETDFGRYGMVAFAVTLAIALLLLYALLLVILVPRCRKKRDSFDFTASSSKTHNKEGGSGGGGTFAMGQRSHAPLGPTSSATGLNGEYITSVDLDAAAGSPTTTNNNNSGGGGAGNDARGASDDEDDEPGSANDPKKETGAEPESESADRFVSTFLIGRLSSSKPTEEETLPPDVTMASDDNVFAADSPAGGKASATAKRDSGEQAPDSSDANTSSSSDDSKDDSSAPDLADKEAAKGEDDFHLAPLAKADSDDAGLSSEIKLTVDPAGIFVSKPTDV